MSTQRNSAGSLLGAARTPAAAETRSENRKQVVYENIHGMIDAYSRIAYSEILPIEDAEHCTAFLQRAVEWFGDHGITIDSVLTDNGVGYRTFAWRDRCADLGIIHTRTRPYTPRTNGKAERLNRTLLDECAYVRTYGSDLQHADTLAGWLHTYDRHRCHTALNGQPP